MATHASAGKILLFLFVGVTMPNFALADAKDSPIPAIQRVITMLDNLIAELDEEAKNDEEKFNHFMAWSAKEIESTNVKILGFQSKIEELEASLSTLQATRVELVDSVKKLNGEIGEIRTQINFATEKRSTESQAYAAEQQEFAAAIAACGKAVKILAAHYGDGSEPEAAARPDFMSLIETLRGASQMAKLQHHSLKAMKLLQAAVHTRRGHLRQPNNERYQAATGEALSIVDQMNLLKDSFVEDKQSAVEDEARLQKQYDSLMKEKTEMLNSLVEERDSQQKRLDKTNQEIAETEGELSRTNRALVDAQAYVASVTTNRNEFEEMYKQRRDDREAETQACKEAVSVLAKYRPSLLQRVSVLTRLSRGSARSRDDIPTCKTCNKAASLLRQRATSYHSTLLQAAAAATEGSDAMAEIITALEGLVERLKVEQQAEKEHKEWCEKETGFTTAKRDDHSAIVEDIKNVLANLSEVLTEKKDGIVVVVGEENTEDTSFGDLQHLREEEHTEYESDHEEHVQAIAALNEAIDILAKFYASRKASLLQTAGGRQAADQPAMGGGKAVQLIGEVRHEFEVSKEHIEHEEVEAEALFETNKKQHIKVATDLRSEENQLTVEKQTTEEGIEQNTNDKKDNEDEVKSAEEYLDRLGKSCYPLLMRYDDRVKQRQEEEASLKDAIKVLREEA